MIDASGQGGGWLSDTEQQHWLACGAGPPGGGTGIDRHTADRPAIGIPLFKRGG